MVTIKLITWKIRAARTAVSLAIPFLAMREPFRHLFQDKMTSSEDVPDLITEEFLYGKTKKT